MNGGNSYCFPKAIDSPPAQPHWPANCLPLGLCKGTVKQSSTILANLSLKDTDKWCLPWHVVAQLRTHNLLLSKKILGCEYNFSSALCTLCRLVARQLSTWLFCCNYKMHTSEMWHLAETQNAICRSSTWWHHDIEMLFPYQQPFVRGIHWQW